MAAGLGIARLTEAYREVRYEALHERGAQELAALAKALGLTIDDEWSARAIAACDIGRLRQGDAEARIPWDREEPRGFYGEGRREAWRDELSQGQLRAIEYTTAELMTRLGYERVTRTGRKPLQVRRLDALQRIHGALDWRLRRAAAGL